MHSLGTENIALGLSGEELLARLFNDFFYGVTIVNADSEIVYYNGTQALIDGLSPSDALGKTLDEVHRQDGRPAPTLAASLSRTPAVNQPFLYRTASGRLVNSVQNAFPITKDGVLLGCVTFIGEYGRIMDAYSAAAGVWPSGSPPAGGNGEASDGPEADDADSDGKRAKGAKGRRNGRGGVPEEEVAKGGLQTAAAPPGSFVTADKGLLAVADAAHRAADSPSPILFAGEMGSGKDLLARTVASASGRKGGPFLALNFGSMPESLLDGILFGTEAGAYTGAADRPGILELASGGTVYLNEICAIPPAIQERLLAAVEEGRAPRVGAAAGSEREFDVKFMSASSVPLDKAVSSGQLKTSLLAKLGVVTLNLPPLRERLGDAQLLTDHFVKSYGAAFSRQAEGVSDEVKDAFSRYAWPGNVSELKSGIEGAMNALSQEETLLTPVHFTSTLLGHLFKDREGASGQKEGPLDGAQRPAHFLHSAAEAERIAAALEAAGGNAAKAARSLKISPQLMNYKLKKFALKKKITVEVG
ncbi:MAG: sigma 54-interacting transcriptional regulator [Deltaproteobacteria bacterium]|jgi:arginine utilization regulatory protein|nr:sigma 54-interacting transcriptional regulator [Deltaproteobacteria bacterium]